MADNFTSPDPLRIGTKTLSIYITELQECVNIRKEQIGQPAVTFVNQNIGKTTSLAAIDELKTLTNQLAIDFGFVGGVANEELLGRAYVNNPIIWGCPVLTFNIINDLRRVLDLLDLAVPLVTSKPGGFLSPESGTFANLKASAQKEGEPEGVFEAEEVSTFPIGTQGGAGQFTFYTFDEIVEVKSVSSPEAGLGFFILNRFDPAAEQELFVLPGFALQLIDVISDGLYIYLLTSEGDGEYKIQRLDKTNPTSINATWDISGPIGTLDHATGAGYPWYTFSYLTIDESNIYALGVKTYYRLLQQGSNWAGPPYPNDNFQGVPSDGDLTFGAIATINKSTGSASIAEFNFNNETGTGYLGRHHAEPITFHKFVGGAACDDSHIYAVYFVEERWRFSDNPATADNFWIGTTDPVLLTGHGPPHAAPPAGNCYIGSGSVWYWIGTGDNTQFMEKHEMSCLQWSRPVGQPCGNSYWIGCFSPSDIHSGSLPVSSYVIKIPKGSTNATVLEPGGLLFTGSSTASSNSGFAVYKDNLYIRFWHVDGINSTVALRVINKNDGTFVSSQSISGFSAEIQSIEDYQLTNPDISAPKTSQLVPTRSAENVQSATNISVVFTDSGSGVASSTIKMKVNAADVTNALVISSVTGGFKATYDPPGTFPDGQVTVEVSARDLSGNKVTDSWVFQVGT